MSEVESLFVRATREQFRFESPQGDLITEDLWSLPLTSEKPGRANLDDIAIALDKKVKALESSGSFVKPKSKDTTTPAMFAVVKYIIDVKVAEAEQRRKERENQEQRQKIMAIMASKKDKNLEASSLEELQAELDKLKLEP